MAEIDRRSFLAALTAAAAGLGLSLVAGQAPPLEVVEEAAEELGCSLDEMNELTRKYIMPGVIDSYFKQGPLMRYVKARR